MILWPAGVAVAVVWAVFRDPAFDYRVLVAAALLPDLVDAPFGGIGVAHTFAFSAVLLTVVMVATRGRRRARRRWLAAPIGILVHLLADGVWTKAGVFWWPLSGASLTGPIPALDHNPLILFLEELAGAALLLWFWRRFRLSDPAVRRQFFQSGYLPRDVVR